MGIFAVTINFLFWNTGGNPIQDTIANLVLEHDIDVLMLAEWSYEPEPILLALKQRGVNYFEATQAVDSNCERIVMFTSFQPEVIRPVWEDERLTVRQLRLPQVSEIILAVTHFRSQRNTSDATEDQARQARNTIEVIQEQEILFSNTRTILVGDFNMDPFDDGMISPDAFNAVMTQQLAQKETQVVMNKEYRFFYNPMWGYFGDRSSGPPGTYYHRQRWPYWHIFDQVLIRTALSSRLTDLKIITNDGTNSFLTKKGIPNVLISDHLPLKFSMALEE